MSDVVVVITYYSDSRAPGRDRKPALSFYRGDAGQGETFSVPEGMVIN